MRDTVGPAASLLWFLQEESVEDDVDWDDSELIAAYDRAYVQIQEQIESRAADSSKNASSQQPPTTIGHQLQSQGWKKGDFCTAIYSGDGSPYEAKINRVRGREWHFIGYGNEVLSSDLQPSEGAEARQAQRTEAGWKKGDFCTAIYSGDGSSYEAKIKCVRGRECIVHFIGYGKRGETGSTD
ncbi:survival of motor neuron protein-like [Haemaphysalis longicornis]